MSKAALLALSLLLIGCSTTAPPRAAPTPTPTAAAVAPTKAQTKVAAPVKEIRAPTAARKPQVRRLDSMDVYALAPSAYLLAYGHMLKASQYLSTQNLTQLTPHIQTASLATGLDPALIAAVIMVESGAVRDAVSEKGAQGLMQLMPTTAQELELSDPFDPEANIMAGSTYLKRQLTRFGRLDLALAAYNAGPQAVVRAHGIPAYAQTQGFVRKVLSAYAQLKAGPGL